MWLRWSEQGGEQDELSSEMWKPKDHVSFVEYKSQDGNSNNKDQILTVA